MQPATSNTVLRLWEELDTSQSGKSAQKGVYAKQLNSLKGIQYFLAKLFGTKVEVNNEVYVVSSKSYNAFKARNADLKLGSLSSSTVKQLTTISKNEKKLAQVEKQHRAVTKTISFFTEKKALQLAKPAIQKLLGAQGLGLTEQLATEIANKADATKPFKEQLPGLLKDHIDSIPHKGEPAVKKFVEWLKKPTSEDPSIEFTVEEPMATPAPTSKCMKGSPVLTSDQASKKKYMPALNDWNGLAYCAANLVTKNLNINDFRKNFSLEHQIAVLEQLELNKSNADFLAHTGETIEDTHFKPHLTYISSELTKLTAEEQARLRDKYSVLARIKS